MKIYLIFIIYLFSIINCSANSGCGFRIRGLVLNNELAILGKISSIEVGDLYSKMFIEIEDLMLGDVASKAKEVMFSSYDLEEVRVIFKANATCIIFARPVEIQKASVYFSSTCYRITGSKDKINAYSKAIKEFVEINKLDNDKKKNDATVNWCIKNLFIEELNWQSIEELSFKGFLYTYDNKRYKRNKIKLSRHNKNTIRHYLLSKKVLEYNDPWLIDLVFKSSNKAILEKLISQLVKKDLSKDVWYPEINLLGKIAELKKDKELTCIVEEIKEIGVLSKSVKVKELVAQFIELIK